MKFGRKVYLMFHVLHLIFTCEVENMNLLGLNQVNDKNDKG